MPINKTIVEVLHTRLTTEGAGVKLHRGFSNPEVPKFDPFLLFDDFSGNDPADYMAGFPWHPHRGIETVTYVLHGDVKHHDSTGRSGVIRKGDVQWMTAGSGIMHEEMPEGSTGMKGFQLWVNLPKKHKMTEPKYRDVISKEIPDAAIGKNATAKVIAGTVNDVKGPAHDLMVEPLYVDIKIKHNKDFSLPIPEGYNTFVYIFSGQLALTDKSTVSYKKDQIILFSRTGDTVSLRAGSSGARLLLASGMPLNEPVAWYGPIVMNTDNELQQALFDLKMNNFVR